VCSSDLHTKFVFNVDNKKSKLTDNFIFYLYDLNCNFKRIDFNDITDLETKINDLLNKRRFGKDLKKISDVSISLATLTNTWLRKNDLNEISVLSINFQPIVEHIPCEALSFNYDISLNDNRIIKLNLKKIADNNFKLSFKENDWNSESEISDLSLFPESIGEMIKKYLLK
jgi:hypothetical protein